MPYLKSNGDFTFRVVLSPKLLYIQDNRHTSTTLLDPSRPLQLFTGQCGWIHNNAGNQTHLGGTPRPEPAVTIAPKSSSRPYNCSPTSDGWIHNNTGNQTHLYDTLDPSWPLQLGTIQLALVEVAAQAPHLHDNYGAPSIF
jgi:hypothetical protein